MYYILDKHFYTSDLLSCSLKEVLYLKKTRFQFDKSEKYSDYFISLWSGFWSIGRWFRQKTGRSTEKMGWLRYQSKNHLCKFPNFASSQKTVSLVLKKFQDIWITEKKIMALEFLVNPFHTTGLFVDPLKTENLRFCDIFRGNNKATLTCNRLFIFIERNYFVMCPKMLWIFLSHFWPIFPF